MADISPTISRIPCTLITGFLGAGKTTLVNYLLRTVQDIKFAVINNEFALEFGIENELMEVGSTASFEEVFEFGNGCICCSSGAELLRVLGRLATNTTIQHVLIETTGRADPGPVALAFEKNQKIRDRFFIDGIVTVVDGVNVLSELKRSGPMPDMDGFDQSKQPSSLSSMHAAEMEYKNEPLSQIVYADRLLVNKVDLMPLKGPQSAAELILLLKKLNPFALVATCVNSEVDPRFVLNIASTNLEKVLKSAVEQQSLLHDPAIQAISLAVEGDVVLERVLSFLDELIASQGDDIFRIKGALSVYGVAERVVLQGVHDKYSYRRHRTWKADEERTSVLVFIGREMEKHQTKWNERFQSCAAPAAPA